MQRRDFSRAVLGATAAGTLGAWLPTAAWAQGSGLREGSDYRRLARPAPVDAPAGKVEVIEFFAYTCVHCYNFEPAFKDWMKTVPGHVVARRSPVGFNASFEPLQRLYFTLEALGQLDALHDRVFKAIHQDRVRLNNADAIIAWAAAQGLNQAQFTQTFNSFGVAGKVKRANQLQDAYEVEATPSLGIAGRYYVPGQAARTLTVANALIQEARKG
ncbi:thiol:disulfide interchange protein DsbA/DsbL [Aquabacterium sp. A08]|uniref:thiol:disulfide interchange protein DsbA/DsbL n=1 Tax=Aquabacterium sp. A08 TaxID=2718532 RepID=UPI001421F21A|nr:thiol:disulfide interchange protein DsbA/DsbL [Aquabacterium sp. A08]NIC43282.1 thiol:disulfide interchange protein DsbA/DsbL [Aquabacterium sp. A08]